MFRTFRVAGRVPAITTAALLVVAGAAAAQDLPTRRAGLWEMSMQATNGPSQVVRQCIDERTDAQMQRFAQGMDLKNCTRNVWRKDGERYLGESECKFGSTTSTSRAVFSGDFSKAYRGEIDARYSPPMAGMSQSKMTITARWIGACPAGWKAGDMEMPGMGRINVNEMMAGRAAKRP